MSLYSKAVRAPYDFYSINAKKLLLVWAATCRDESYIKLQGLKRLVTDPSHRKELIAGNLGDRLVTGLYFLINLPL